MTSINGSEVVADPACEVWGNAAHRAARAAYIGADLLLTVLGNGLTIAVTRRVEEFSDGTKALLTSLAAADLGVAFVAATSLAAEVSGGWALPAWVCRASFACFYVFTAVSVYMLVLMTLDRTVAVVRPLRYSLLVTRGRCLAAVALVWLACAAGAVLTATSNQIAYSDCSALCVTQDRDIFQSLVAIVAFFLVPLALISLMNAKLVLVARRHAVRSGNRVAAASVSGGGTGAQRTPGPGLRGALAGKAVGVVALVTVAFVVSWSLFYVRLVLRAAASRESAPLPEWLEFASIWLALTNSWWNVVLYSVMNRSFRLQLGTVLRRLCSWLPARP